MAGGAPRGQGGARGLWQGGHQGDKGKDVNENPTPKSPQSGGGVEAAGPQQVRRTREGPGAPRPCRSLQPGLPLAAQQLHTQGDTVVPSYGQDAHEASQEGHLKHVLLVGVIVQVPGEDLEAEAGSGGHPAPALLPSEPQGTPGGVKGGQPTDTHLAVYGTLVPVLRPVPAVVTVGDLVGCHVLDVAKVSGPLCDNASHTPRGAQVNLRGERNQPCFLCLSRRVGKRRHWDRLLHLAGPQLPRP